MPTMLDLARTSGNISEGTHAFKVTRVEEKVSSNNNDTLWIYMTCIDEVGDDKGKSQLLFLTLTPAARFRLDQFLDAINAPTTGRMSVSNFVGKKLRCVLTESTRQGNEGRMEVTRMLPYSDDPGIQAELFMQGSDEESVKFAIPGIPDSEVEDDQPPF